MYVLLVALAAVVVPLLQAGHTRLVLLGSFGLWLAYQLTPGQADFPWTIAGNALFPVSAWQLLFCMGLTVGHHWDAIRALARPHARGWLLWAAGIATVSLICLFLMDHALRLIPSEANWLLFGKGHVGVGRIVATMAVLAFGFLLTAAAWTNLVRWIGWFVLPLGRQSLRCYILHVPVVYAAAVIVHAGGHMGTAASAENTLLQVGALLFLWLAALSRQIRSGKPSLNPAPVAPPFAASAFRAGRALVLTIFRY
jgi:hypothetical protein